MEQQIKIMMVLTTDKEDPTSLRRAGSFDISFPNSEPFPSSPPPEVITKLNQLWESFYAADKINQR